jgi:hypothetical protein
MADSSGEFLKVDLREDAVAALWLTDQLDGVLKKAVECSLSPLSAYHSPAYCGRDITDMRYDPIRKLVYMLAPDIVADRNNPYGTGEGSFSYRVYIFALEDMHLIKSFEVQGSNALMVTPDGQMLLVQHYAGGGQKVTNTVDVYETTGFKKIRTVSGSTSDPPAFGPLAKFLPDGKTSVLYGYLRTHWDWSAGVFTNDTADPRTQLTAPDREKLKPFEAEDPKTHEHLLVAGPGETAAGKTVFLVTDKAHAKMGFWTMDMLTQKTSPPILASTGLALLTPDAKAILLAGSKPSPKEQGHWDFSGDFSLYDVATGSRLKEYSNSQLATSDAEGGPACFSPDGEKMVYLLKDKVLVVEVSSGKVVHQIRVRLTTTNASNYRVCAFNPN